jgi:hypothetical protein
MFGPSFSINWPLMGLIAGVGLALAGVYSVGYNAGEAKVQAGFNAYKAEIAEQDGKAQKELARLNSLNAEMRLKHAKQILEIHTNFLLEKQREKAVDDAVVADLKSGNRKLRVQVASCFSRPTETGTNPKGTDGAGVAELSPGAGEFFYGQSAEADRLKRKVTALQAWVNSAIQRCGVKNE